MYISTPEGLSRHTISCSATIREALQHINLLSGDAMTLFVMGPDWRLAGSLTDGDIRRGLLAGYTLDHPVAEIMHRMFRALTPECDRFTTAREAARARIDLLPMVDSDGRLTGIVDLRKAKELLPLDAVLMAGGKGERLRPLTLTTPKPLLPVGGKPIIDHNIDELIANGVEQIYVTVNYLKEQIIDHFKGHPNVTCVEEPSPLGTIGSLSLLPPLQHDNLLLMNSDLLTSLDFAALYTHHLASEADVTMAVVPYTVSVPFAILQTNDGLVEALREKPTYNYLANAGVYIMRSALLQRLKPGERLDAPEFVESLIADGGKVAYFPIAGTWVDIGTPDDYRNACRMNMF